MKKSRMCRETWAALVVTGALLLLPESVVASAITDTVTPGSTYYTTSGSQSISFQNASQLAGLQGETVSSASLQLTFASADSAVTSTAISGPYGTNYGNCVNAYYGTSCTLLSRVQNTYNYSYSTADTSSVSLSDSATALYSFSDSGTASFALANTSVTNTSNTVTVPGGPANVVYCQGGTCSNGWTAFYFNYGITYTGVPTTNNDYYYNETFGDNSMITLSLPASEVAQLLSGSAQVLDTVGSGNVAITAATLTFDQVQTVPIPTAATNLWVGLAILASWGALQNAGRKGTMRARAALA